MKRLATTALAAVLAGMSAVAQTSEEYALMGRTAMVAFECSYLAHVSEKDDEAERLFGVGYDNGIAFVEAMRSEKVKSEDVNSTAYHIAKRHFNVPSDGSIVGVIYQISVQTLIYKWRDEGLDDFFWNNEYHERNCALIK